MSDDENLAIEIYKSNLLANLGGQLFVHDVELDGAGRELAERSGADVPFFRLPFKEAIEHFTRRRLVTADEFETLSDAERFRSFAVTRASSKSLVQRIKKALDNVMGNQRSTATLRDFIKLFEDKADGFTANYLENVFRTTTAASYNSGRKRAQEGEAVASALPFWQYLTANDSRVRDEHARLHKAVWPIEQFPQEIYPPNGYNCRCIVVSRTAEQAKRFPDGRRLSTDGVTQEGFAAPPDVVVEQEASLG